MPIGFGPPSRRDVLRLLAGGIAGVAAGELAGCTPSSRTTPPTGTPSQGTQSQAAPRTFAFRDGGLDVRDYGAEGDGRTDDSDAIERALADLKPGGTLTFPGHGVFCHTRVIAVETRGVYLQGPGTLRATSEENSALQIAADGVTLTNLTVSISETTRRWSAAEQHKIYLGPYGGISLRGVQVEGSAAAGVFSYGATNFHFDNVAVRDTRADGIHMTNGSRDGLLTSPQITRSGDDGVAVVSYLQDPTPCGRIKILSPRVRTTTGGRGISVVGGHDVLYLDIDIDRSSAASVYIACEGGDFVTHPTSRATVRGGRITNANTDATIDHGAVLVYSGRAGGSVEDVHIEDLTVRGTRSTASRQIGVVVDGPDDLVADIAFRRLDLASSPTPYQGDAPVSDVSTVGVSAAGTQVRVTQ